MSRKALRSVLVKELNELSEGNLKTIVKKLDIYWNNAFNKNAIGKITDFPGAKKAGEIEINEYDVGSILPRLKSSWEKGVKHETSCYIIVVDGFITKIGALKDGVKSVSFAQYLTGVAGSPSRRSAVVYTFLSSMLRHGHKVEIYHVTMNTIANVSIPTIKGFVNTEIHYSHFDIEKQNLVVYKDTTNGHVPLLNFKERNATVPQEFDVLYDLVNKRVRKNKRYTNLTENTTNKENVVAETVVAG